MKYSKEILIAQIEAGEVPDFIFFWGHQPKKDLSISNNCFSQWYQCTFTVDGKTYKTAEHWMMANKASLFGDKNIAHQILATDDPEKVKSLGRLVHGYNDKIWNNHKVQVVIDGNYHKFSQNKKLKDYLRSSNPSVLVEASPVDLIWGIGLAAENKLSTVPKAWRGLNLLGFALMEVRDKLQ